MRMGITLQTFACTCWLAVGLLAEWGPENGYRSTQPTLHTPAGCIAQGWELTGGQRTGNGVLLHRAHNLPLHTPAGCTAPGWELHGGLGTGVTTTASQSPNLSCACTY